MSPRLRLLALIVAVEMVFAAVFFAARDDKPGPEFAADRRSTSTTSDATTTTAEPVLDTTTSVAAAVTTAAPGTSPTTARRTATSARPATTQPPTTGPPGVVDRVALRKVATMNQPIALSVNPTDAGSVYIAEKGGRVRSLRLNSDGSATLDGAIVMDITTKVSKGGEQGLLGIAFAPDGNHLYANYTDLAGDTRVVEYPFANRQANVGAERLVLTVDQPYDNHNGGHVVFGQDGLLYIGLGDGGSGGDPQGYGQRLNTLLGKILRIDPRAAGTQPYTVPAGNPFVGQSGARAEIWHFGLRNPWRFSFDRGTGDQWIGDVGQGAWEEVDHVGAGRGGVNFGWNNREGAHAYNGGAKPAGAVDPEYELSHNGGNCSITGGFVYRGAAIRGLAGTYVFADYCRGRLTGAANGALRELNASLDAPSSFGEDAAGELWALSLGGDVYRVVRG